ncbi:MAG: hypothetical protein QOK41_1072 [Sphingomonadales bacterium]|jgi:uncharacterized protein (TIGR02300 family)|nr:hypothetical protein [Sphingomonadales bacterium]
MVPFPLAAGPSTAIRRSPFDERRPASFDAFWSAKARALTGAYAYGKARPRTPPATPRRPREFELETFLMVKPEWGTKRTCPKCSTRFYDLGHDDPVHCINCGTDFAPEPVLKSKQPMAFEAAPAVVKEPAEDKELAADDLAVDEDEEISPDEEVDLETGDDDLGVETAGEEDDG